MPKRITISFHGANRHRYSFTEIIISSLLAGLSLAIVTWISYQFLNKQDIPFILASMGASTIILFLIPSSPMGRPWAFFAGNIISAVIGITCAQLFTNLLISIPIAMVITLIVMQLTRCIHPPGGATALIILLGSEQIHNLSYQFLITPLLLNLIILAACAYGFNHLLQQRRRKTPHIPQAWHQRHNQTITQASLSEDDLRQVLNQQSEYIDVNAKQLHQLFNQAHQQRQQRLLGNLLCHELMEPTPLEAEFGTELHVVWKWLTENENSATVVIDRARHVLGIVTLSDFIKHAEAFDLPSQDERITALITPTPTLTSDKPEAAGQIMIKSPLSVPGDTKVSEALQLMQQHKIHHLPVVDSNNKLQGLLNYAQIQNANQTQPN